MVDSVTYNLNRRNDFGAQATVIQFPIVLAYGITVHKIQGGSIPSPSTVGMDIKNVFAASQAYVMMSRVQTLNQVFFIDEFVDEKIYLNKYAYEENQRLHQISLNRNRGPWDEDKIELFKIASLNCRGLSTNFEDIKSDKKLLQADVLMLQEISLLGNIEDDSNTDNVYSRNFLRNEIIPKIMERWPGAKRNTARMANLLTKQSSLYHRFLLERLADVCDEDGLLLDKLSELDYFERSEMIRIWLDQQSFASPNESQMKELEKSFFQSRQDANPTIKFYREDAQKTGVILSKINNYLIAEKINE